jgi:hypothetical protein
MLARVYSSYRYTLATTYLIRMSCLNSNIFVLKSRYTYNFRTIFLTVMPGAKIFHATFLLCIRILQVAFEFG